MVWDFNSFSMEEPNVDEREWAMHFCIGTTCCLSPKQIWGKSWTLVASHGFPIWH